MDRVIYRDYIVNRRFFLFTVCSLAFEQWCRVRSKGRAARYGNAAGSNDCRVPDSPVVWRSKRLSVCALLGKVCLVLVFFFFFENEL